MHTDYVLRHTNNERQISLFCEAVSEKTGSPCRAHECRLGDSLLFRPDLPCPGPARSAQWYRHIHWWKRIIQNHQRLSVVEGSDQCDSCLLTIGKRMPPLSMTVWMPSGNSSSSRSIQTALSTGPMSPGFPMQIFSSIVPLKKTPVGGQDIRHRFHIVLLDRKNEYPPEKSFPDQEVRQSEVFQELISHR